MIECRPTIHLIPSHLISHAVRLLLYLRSDSPQSFSRPTIRIQIDQSPRRDLLRMRGEFDGSTGGGGGSSISISSGKSVYAPSDNAD